LLMDVSSPQEEGGIAVAQIELRGFVLPVLAANVQELAGHEDVLAQLDKASGGKALWRKLI
jgi:DNA polymerase-3 subunit epsilon